VNVSTRAFNIGSALCLIVAASAFAQIGQEVAVPHHLSDASYPQDLKLLIPHGQRLFEAVWTVQEGGGRPLSKGVGAPLSDLNDPLLFPRNFNRISAPDANSCHGCHNKPRSGGGGDIVANVFVLGQRFDFATFDHDDSMPTKGAVDESGTPVEMQTIANSRNTLGMFGSGYIEMLARQMTADLQATRDSIKPGGSAELRSKGLTFGILSRTVDGTWETDAVEGLPFASTKTSGSQDPPSLILRPFHQVGAVVSLREFTNNAFNHHHGIQSVERFGNGLDPDDDGFVDEMTVADVTAATLFQAALAVPGRVIPRDPEIETAIRVGEDRFIEIGCGDCHVPALPLGEGGWVFTEPNPYNPAGNLQVGEMPTVSLDLNDPRLDQPRLRADLRAQIVWVPAFTDLKLHDITSGSGDPNREPLDQTHPAGSPEFFEGNSRFLTRKLWGVANEPPYFHHGQYTTLREAIEAHHGEAESQHQEWSGLATYDRDAIVEFLKSLQVLPEGTRHRIVDETGRPRRWRR